MSQLAANLTSRLTGSDTQRLQKIHETGYWRVRIRPTEFRKNLIPSLGDCRTIMRSSLVRLRGWDYPRWAEEEIANGQDWIQGGSDWSSHIEYWRFFQSGQFIHHFAMREDHRPYGDTRFLVIPSTLFTVTEIIEFAARLARHGVFIPGAELSIRLEGTEGRLLQYGWDPYSSADVRCCRVPSVEFEQTYEPTELLGNAPALALTAAKSIFERFNWNEIPDSILVEDQRKFLERRL